MEVTQLDIEKIKLLTVTTQVNCLITLLVNINKEDLITGINSILPEHRGSSMYKFLKYTLEFYENVETELQKETKDDGQSSFKF